MPLLAPGEPWATAACVDGALSRGIELSRADWRNIFLAITDCLDPEGPKSLAKRVTAKRVGPVRDGERWTVSTHNRTFDVIYSPRMAVMTGATDTRLRRMAGHDPLYPFGASCRPIASPE